MVYNSFVFLNANIKANCDISENVNDRTANFYDFRIKCILFDRFLLLYAQNDFFTHFGKMAKSILFAIFNPFILFPIHQQVFFRWALSCRPTQHYYIGAGQIPNSFCLYSHSNWFLINSQAWLICWHCPPRSFSTSCSEFRLRNLQILHPHFAAFVKQAALFVSEVKFDARARFLFIGMSKKSDKDYFQVLKDNYAKKFLFERKEKNIFKQYIYAQLAENFSFAVARFNKEFT